MTTLPIIFLHAASYTGKMWLPQMQMLRGECLVYAPDLPGHGTHAGEEFCFASAVGTVIELMDTENIARALVVGVSLGGLVAICAAARHPERVAGLILSGCTFDACRPLAQLILTGESLVFPRGAQRFTRRWSAWVRAHYSAQTAEEMIDAGTYWKGAAQAVSAMRGVDFRARLSVYPGPSLLLNGERDWVHRTSEASYARAARNATVQLVSGAGHIPNLDAPDVYTDAVCQFVLSLSP